MYDTSVAMFTGLKASYCGSNIPFNHFSATVILRDVHDRNSRGEPPKVNELHGIIILIVGMLTLLLFGFASTKETEMTNFFTR